MVLSFLKIYFPLFLQASGLYINPRDNRYPDWQNSQGHTCGHTPQNVLTPNSSHMDAWLGKKNTSKRYLAHEKVTPQGLNQASTWQAAGEKARLKRCLLPFQCLCQHWPDPKEGYYLGLSEYSCFPIFDMQFFLFIWLTNYKYLTHTAYANLNHRLFSFPEYLCTTFNTNKSPQRKKNLNLNKIRVEPHLSSAAAKRTETNNLSRLLLYPCNN